MRTKAKLNAKLGHSKAILYRNGLFSPASDLEALVDAYGLNNIIHYAKLIERDLHEHGDSIYNGIYNQHLNCLPLPVLRKQNKPENKAKAKKRR